MRLQNSIIASALVSFVCAAPFVEGKNNKAVVPSSSGPLDSSSLAFNDDGSAPRSVLRKRATKAAEAVDELFDELNETFSEHEYKELEGKIPEYTERLESVQEIVKDSTNGGLKEKVVYIAKIIEAFKDLYKMKDIFDGCDYPGSILVSNILETKVYALLAANAVDESKEEIIAHAGVILESQVREKVKGMAPALEKVFDTKTEEVREIIKSFKEDNSVEEELSSGIDAPRDSKKTCPEIVSDMI